ncbi:rhomboid family intramembrane serine protease [Mesobacillus maritimus]|uniref:rhomboid family intramembrane serine protease n=1 Tax=Mesobacillus maritimus TaxID=1643336 RepID=UPI00384F7581
MTAEYLFWKTANLLIVNEHYRILQISKDRQEIWLEKVENKSSQIYRLLCTSLDWSHLLQRDIGLVVGNGSKVRNKLVRGHLTITNLYFMPLPPVDDYEYLLTQPKYSPGKGRVKVTSFVLDSRNLSSSQKTLKQLLGEQVTLDLHNDFIEEEIQNIRKQALSDASTRAKAEQAIFHSGIPFFTYILIAIQLIVFLLMEFKGGSTDSSTLINFGAKFNPLILEGEWWRFFTPMFLHIGFLHLVMNSLALYYLGPMVERIYGNVRFLFLYLFAGFAGVLASFLFSANLSAGASGAIFGCFGALLYFGVIFPRLFMRSLGFNILIVLAINLVFGFTIPGIDNAGHIGGLLGGFAAAGILRFPRKKRLGSQAIFLAATAALIVGMLQYGYSDSASVVDRQSILILAQDYIKNEEFDQAYRLLDDYRAKDGDSPEILFLLSFTEIKRDNIENAKSYLLRVIELDPKFHEAHYNLSLVYLEQGSFEEAKIHAEHALGLNADKKEYKDLLENISSYMKMSDT